MEGFYVLAIEPDWRIRKLIRANLEALGLEVGEAVSGGHGLQVLRDSYPDLVLLDLDLPDNDVRYLLDTLQAMMKGRRMSVIVLAQEPPSRQWRKERQVLGYLQKPFAVLALLHQVRRALMDSDDGD